MSARRGSMQVAVIGTAAIAAALVALMMLSGRAGRAERAREDGSAATTLEVFVAAGLRLPFERIATQYEREFGVKVVVHYDGSKALLSALQVSRTGDLYVAADDSYITEARGLGLVKESLDLATMAPVLAVRKGNPKRLAGFADLLRDDVAVSLGDPDRNAIGKAVKEAATRAGSWERLAAKATTFKLTVNDLANDLRLGAVDAAVVWDALAAQEGYRDALDVVRVPELAANDARVQVGVLTRCGQPRTALRFARYLAAPEKGGAVWTASGYGSGGGDRWAVTPQVTLYAGSVNRKSVEETIREFQEREGVAVSTVYNGCGILCGEMEQMQGKGQVPDMYLACDVCFIEPVKDMFPEAVVLSEAEIVIAVAKGNPKDVRSLADLAREGMRVGIPNARESTLGFLAERMLKDLNILNAVRPNVAAEAPTADILVAQLAAGRLDAAIVYVPNIVDARDRIEAVHLKHPGAKAMQPFAVAQKSPHRHLSNRLLEHMRVNRARYENAGFTWVDTGAAPAPVVGGTAPPPGASRVTPKTGGVPVPAPAAPASPTPANAP